jgi:hypothetical protein
MYSREITKISQRNSRTSKIGLIRHESDSSMMQHVTPLALLLALEIALGRSIAQDSLACTCTHNTGSTKISRNWAITHAHGPPGSDGGSVSIYTCCPHNELEYIII